MTNYLIYDPKNADTEQSSDHLLRSALSFLLDGRKYWFSKFTGLFFGHATTSYRVS